MARPPGRFAEIGGARLYFERDDAGPGAGPAIVFIHGFALDRRMWDPQFASLSGRRPLLRYDCRGFGASSLPAGASPAGYTHADDLVALLRTLAIDRADLVGLSMGAQIALEVAAARPEIVNRLVLAGAWLVDYPFSEEWRSLWSAIGRAARDEDTEAARAIWLARGPIAPALSRPRAAARIRLMAEDYSGWHFRNPRHDPFRAVSERLHEIRTPARVVVGERDWPDFHGIADRIAGRMRGVEKVVLRGAGHLAPLEAPRRFSGLIAGADPGIRRKGGR